MQFGYGTGTDKDGQIIPVQMYPFPVFITGLQRQRTEAEGKDIPERFSVRRYSLHDLCIGKRFTAAGACHIDYKIPGTIPILLPECSDFLDNCILPSENCRTFLCQRLYIIDALHLITEIRKSVSNMGCLFTDPDQMFLQKLLFLSGFTVCIRP